MTYIVSDEIDLTVVYMLKSVFSEYLLAGEQIRAAIF